MASSKKIDFISKDDCYLFGQGTHYEIYKKLGAHPLTLNGKPGYYFAVWAPNAVQVGVVGDFNSWNPDSHLMETIYTSGIWEIWVPDLAPGELYKFTIYTKNGELLFKADPYARAAEYRPGTASILASEPEDYSWKDKTWMTKRALADTRHAAMSIYECHLGSWKKCLRPERDNCMNYRELAVELADYVKDMGYTHIELMGIAEYPYDGSWGYQVTGYYAPTSRYGSLEDFEYFVNYMHKKGIGVLLDWVPAHFPKDAFGLSEFDGQAEYEYADPQKGEHPDWGTKVFDYTKTEVTNFLIANALYWLNEFHIDGLRVDAVASMLYLDYGRNSGGWTPNKNGDNKNLEAIEFFKHLNSVIAGRKDGTVIIAEESTVWPKVTHAPEDDGLGFTFKWNMGWMHDFIEYMKLDPYFRKANHNKMTFGITYATSENFILVLSHDEVVHLKSSMLNKMPGIYEDKFANLKCGYAFMMGQPGKKLLFMGQDFAQNHEWDEKVALDWQLCEDTLHNDVKQFFKGLLYIYKKYSCLYELDDNKDGFEWINANDASRSIFSWVRYDKIRKKSLLFVISFTPVERDDYMVGVPKKGKYKLILDETYGSYDINKIKKPSFTAELGECDGREYHISYPIPRYGVAVFEF